MSVIARKIAIANEAPSDRSDPEDMVASLTSDLKTTLSQWLSADDISLDLVKADWALPAANHLTGPMIACRGADRSQRAALWLNSALADYAVLSLLRMDVDASAKTLVALKPFAVQNIVALGDRLNHTHSFSSNANQRCVWSEIDAERLETDFSQHPHFACTWRVTGLHETEMMITLILTQNMMPQAEDEDEVEASRPHLSPRLGPCHVEVRAVGDRVTLSVADCTRLEIGQTIGLKGLRFDKLELDVDMGDGRAPLTDAALGAEKGRKAVRLNRGLDPSFRQKPPSDPVGTAGAASQRVSA